MVDFTPEWLTPSKLAGAAGALISLKFFPAGPWYAKVGMAVSGATLSYFLAPYLSQRVGLPESVGGFLLGMFGMSIASRFWEFLQGTPVAEIWKVALDWIKPKGTP